MTATSPYLDQPKRDPDAAMFDVEDARHRRALREVSWVLQGRDAIARHKEAIDYAIDQLDKHAAARILERNRK